MNRYKTKNGCDIYQVLGGRCNVFLISDGKKHILVDTGRSNKWKKLEAVLSTTLEIEKLEALILTHTHFDHAENATKVALRFKAPVIVHASETDNLELGRNILPVYPSVFKMILKTRIGKWIENKLSYEPAIATVRVDHMLDLEQFGFNGYILHTPGHSRGSQSVIVDDDVALVGDTLYGMIPNRILPPFYENPEELKKSHKLLSKTGCGLYLPSHGRKRTRSLVLKCIKKY
jgi:hydroxyacylglutathione hydrolase